MAKKTVWGLSTVDSMKLEKANAIPASTAGGVWRTYSLGGVSTDTRSIQPGQLFIALQGERYNGHDFLEEAVARGATAALISQNGHAPVPVPTIRVDDTVHAIGALGR